MSDRTYPLSYLIQPEKPPVTSKELDARGNENLGAFDAVIIISMIYPNDGSLSVQITSLDGRTSKDVSAHDLFQVWTMLAKTLSEHSALAPNKRALAQQVFDVVRKAILAGRMPAGRPS